MTKLTDLTTTTKQRKYDSKTTAEMQVKEARLKHPISRVARYETEKTPPLSWKRKEREKASYLLSLSIMVEKKRTGH